MSSFPAEPIYLPDHRDNKDFAIEIPLDPHTLSSKLSDIKECLRLEFAPIQIWHRIGIELYRNGLDSQCNSLLGTALEDDLGHVHDWNTTVCSYEGNPENHINLLNAATVQAINTIHTMNTSKMNDEDYKTNINKATQYYTLARNIAQTYDNTDKYNMVLHFLAGLIQIEKAKYRKEDISQIMIKTKHDLKKALSWKEMEEDEEDEMHHDHDNNDPKKTPLKREPNFISLLCIATLSYSTGDYEDALTNFTKLLRMSLKHADEDNHHYLGFVHLGIGISSLKLREFDIARHAFERAKKIDKVRNNGNVAFVGIKSRIGLALVYLNQHSYLEKECVDFIHNPDKKKDKTMDKKLNSMRKALKEITDAMLYCPNNPQLLVLMANFVGFSCEKSKFTKMWAGTAYDHCQKITNLIESEPSERQILSGLDSKHVLRRDFNVHSMANFNANKERNETLSTCLHPLAKCQAEACYVIAKMYHCANDYNEATKWYYKAVVLSPYFTLALFALSQMYVHLKKMDHAKICLERILKVNKNANEANDCAVLSHYAYVCRQLGEFEKAKEKLERATQLNPSAVDLWIDLAEITEQKNPSYAISKYMRAKHIMLDEEIPFELFNNIIVLCYELGQYEKAKRLSQELIQTTKLTEATEAEHNPTNIKAKIAPHQLIIFYNYARVLDKLCLYKKARKIYRQILLVCPSFIEAILCNALYLYRSGKYMDAIRKFEDAAKKAHDFGDIDSELNAYLYIQRIYSEIGKRTDSENELKRISALKKQNRDIRNDEYSELVAANYMLCVSRNRHHINYYKRLHDALQKFQQILVVNENNVYAVHGLAVAAAESVQLDTAKDIMNKLRDCTTTNSDILVNLGHVYSMQQNWDQALRCYEKARKKLGEHQKGDIPLYIVRTLFAKKDFVSAKAKLHQILRFNPTQELYLYNLALIEEEFACDILRKDPKKRTLAEIENVMKMLENAKRLYQRLQVNKKTAACIPHDKLKQHLDHIKNELIENARKHLEFQRNEEQRKEKKRASEKRKLDKTLERERREKEKLMRVKRAKEEENKQKALLAKQRGKEINFVEPTDNHSARLSKKRKREQVEEDIDEEPAHKRGRNEMDSNEDHMDQFMNRGNNNNNNEEEVDDADFDILNEGETEKKTLRKKLKNSKKKKDKNKKKKNKNKAQIDQDVWDKMKIKIQEIVENADLNTLTNRQVKNQLAECFPKVNIKTYKSLIKEKINAVAQSKTEQND